MRALRHTVGSKHADNPLLLCEQKKLLWLDRLSLSVRDESVFVASHDWVMWHEMAAVLTRNDVSVVFLLGHKCLIVANYNCCLPLDAPKSWDCSFPRKKHTLDFS